MDKIKVLDAVVRICNQYPDAANDDSLLLERYWIEIDGWDTTKSLYQNLQRMTNPETITRRRRTAFNLNLITYSDKALKSRTKAFKNELNNHSNYEKTMAKIVKPKMLIEITNDYGERIMMEV